MSFEESAGPLKGVRILDLSTVVAGPWAATLLADLGADVLKVEIPGPGDPLRALAPHKDGVPLWWKVANRNKKGISVDLRTAAGRDIVARLLPDFDVLVENFRPGTLDGWGMPGEWLRQQNPALTILRVTGFGQTGPYRNKPGFARVFEAMSGLTNICGEPEGRPLHMGFPIADAVAGLFGALGIVAALYREKTAPLGQGQEIDCSLMESMFRVMDFLPIEYDQLGIVRGRLGNSSQYAAPGNVYRTRDGHWASIAASTQRIFERLCVALELDGVAQDPRYRTNPDRVRNRESLDALVAAAIARHTLDELAALLDAHAVGFSPIYDIADIFRDPHIEARQGIVSVQDEELGPVRMQSVVPRFSATPGAVHHAGPSLGQHNVEVLGALGISGEQQAALREQGVI